MKNGLNIFYWMLSAISIILLLGFVGKYQKSRLCEDIVIDIDRSNNNFFVEQEDIYAMVYHTTDSVVGRDISTIDTESMEYKINNHPSVFNSEVYKTIDGRLIVQVEQRTPVIRLFSYNGDSYYIDSTGSIMPTSKRYTARVLVANGHIYDSFIDVVELNAKEMPDSLRSRFIVDDLFQMVEFIRNHDFWEAQIEQLYVNKELEFELIPRVGNHRIVFGDASFIEQKFNKLKIFYEKGLSKTGWNEYSIINLKFANQVVCTKQNYNE